MFKPFFLLSLALVCAFAAAPERKVIVPVNSAKPVGPYSPGILTDDYLYVSGQGVRDAAGKMPDGIEAQTRQCLDNVKAIVETAGLTLEHVVHMQLYLEKIGDLAVVDRVYAAYFPKQPPARTIIGTAKMPTDTTVEMTVVAVRDLKQKKILSLKSLKPLGHASSAVEAAGRVYLSAVYGATDNAAAQAFKNVLAEAKLSASNTVFRNDYGTSATAAIALHELPAQMKSGIWAVLTRKAPVKDASCAVDGKTVYCTVQRDVAANDVQAQTRAVFQKLSANLAKHGATLAHVVASNVYLDDIGEFRPMNETYATFFSAAPPTRTTVQPFAKADRTQSGVALVKISVVAVKE